MTTERFLIDEAAAWLMAREGMSKADALALLRKIRDEWTAGYDAGSYSIVFSRAGGRWRNGRFEILIDDPQEVTR